MSETVEYDEFDEEVSTLWASSGPSALKCERERIFLHYEPYARSIAARLFSARQRDDVQFDDFMQLACIGLLESIERFDPSRGVEFRTFCTTRIRGSILSGIEKLTDAQAQISCRKRIQRDRLSSLASEPALSPLERMAELTVGLAIGFMLSDTGMYQADQQGTTDEIQMSGYESVLWRQEREAMISALDTLPEKMSMIIRYHYLRSLTFTQIATLLGISKSRVSQLHRSGMALLRERAHQSRHSTWENQL